MYRFYVSAVVFAAVLFFQAVPGYSNNNLSSDGDENYRFEINGAYINYSGDDFEMHQYDANVNFYFAPVAVGSHPLAEAAFLEHAGRIIAAGSLMKADLDDGTVDGKAYQVAAEYVFPVIPIYLGAGYSQTKFELDLSPSFEAEMKSNVYTGIIGYYILQGLFAGFSYQRDKTEASLNMEGFEFEPSSVKTDTYGGHLKYVHEFGSGNAFNIELNYEKSILKNDDETLKDESKEIIFDFYIIPQISVGGLFNIVSGDSEDNEGVTLGLRLKLFVFPQIAINCGYSKFKDYGSSETDEDIFEVGLTARI